MDEHAARRIATVAGWLLVASIAVLSLSPDRLQTGLAGGAAGLDHLVAYFLAASLLSFGCTKTGWRLALCGLLVAFGGLIEAAQAGIPGRQPDPVDILANTAGAFAGYLTAVVMDWAVLRIRRASSWSARSPRRT